MKRNVLICLSFVLFLLQPSVSYCLENFELQGDVSMLSVISLKPSSVNQRSSFQMPEGRLGARWTFEPDAVLGGEVLYAKSRDSVDGRYNLQMETIYLELQKVMSDTHWIRFGLIPHPWEVLTERFWGYRHLGARGPTLGFRYGYLARSDLGVITGAHLESWGTWSLMIVNGEGAGADEQGPRKDFHFTIEALPFENYRDHQKLTVALQSIEGAYDNIDPEKSQKERLSLLIGFEQELGWLGSVEWMTSKDPVDGMNLLLADKVDLSAQGGLVAKGQGGSLILKYRWRAPPCDRRDGLYEIFMREDQWNPAVGVDGKGLRSHLLGISFFPRQRLQISLAWSEVLYDNNHATSLRDTSDLLLAARLKW
jgi:hypothetical protein